MYYHRHLQYSEEIDVPRLSWRWKVFLWSLGITDWSEQRESTYNFLDGNAVPARYYPILGRWSLFLTSLMLHSTIILGSLFTAWWHLDCFYYSSTSSLFLISFLLFYWPTVVAAPIICVIASLKKVLSQRHSSAEADRGMNWAAIFEWKSAYQGICPQTRAAKITTEACTLGLFYLLLISNTVMEACYFSIQSTKCQTFTGCLCLISHISNLFFYANFSFYLYLQRRALSVKRKRAVVAIQRNTQNQRERSMEVKNFFMHYYQLRRFLFPCLNVIIFSTAFGMTFFSTWWLNLDIPKGPSYTTTVPSSDQLWSHKGDSLFCSNTCQYEYINSAQESDLYIGKVVTQKVMMASLALIVVGGIDLKYQWNRFKMKMYLVIEYEEGHRSWKRLSELVERLHPDTSTDVIASFIIPLVGVVAGFLSAEHASS